MKKADGISEDELVSAARMFVDNMESNARRLSSAADGYAFAREYLTAVAMDDFDNLLLYGMANGERYALPEEWEGRL